MAEILKDIKSKKLTAKTDLDMGISGGVGVGEDDTKKVRAHERIKSPFADCLCHPSLLVGR